MSELTKMSVVELEILQGEIQITREGRIQELNALQAELVQINAACAVRMASKDYHRKQQQRAATIRQVTEKQAEISDLNMQQKEIGAVLQVRKYQSGAIVAQEVKQLVSIRDKWHEFSMEPSNPKPAREAAWKFSQELRTVLKIHFDRIAAGG